MRLTRPPRRAFARRAASAASRASSSSSAAFEASALFVVVGRSSRAGLRAPRTAPRGGPSRARRRARSSARTDASRTRAGPSRPRRSETLGRRATGSSPRPPPPACSAAARDARIVDAEEGSRVRVGVRGVLTTRGEPAQRGGSAHGHVRVRRRGDARGGERGVESLASARRVVRRVRRRPQRKRAPGGVPVLVPELLERRVGEASEPAEVLGEDLEPREAVALLRPRANRLAQKRLAAVALGEPRGPLAETAERVRPGPEPVQRHAAPGVQPRLTRVRPETRLRLQSQRRALERARARARAARRRAPSRSFGAHPPRPDAG